MQLARTTISLAAARLATLRVRSEKVRYRISTHVQLIQQTVHSPVVIVQEVDPTRRARITLDDSERVGGEP